MILFNTEANLYYQRDHISDLPELIKEAKANEVRADFFEQFLLADKISFKVEGNNFPLAFLITQLGLKQVEELIEQDAIEFVLWTPMILAALDAVHPSLPVVSGVRNSPEYSDPEQSLTTGLNLILVNKPSSVEQKDLIKKLRDKYKFVDNLLYQDAPTIAMEAYETNRLAELGLPFDFPLTRLPLEDRKKLGELGSDVLEAGLLSQHAYSSFRKSNYSSIILKSVESINQASNVQKASAEILRIEHLPDLKNLFFLSDIHLSQLPKLRQKNEAQEFRKWIQGLDYSDGINISKQYIDAVTDSSGFFNTVAGKVIRTLGMCALGKFVGDIPAGPIGGDLLASGLGLFDAFFLGNLTRNYNPRLFIRTLEKELEESPIPPAILKRFFNH